MIEGTNHFVSRKTAIDYYRPYGINAAGVDQKIKEQLIVIGKPEPKPGETIILVDSFTRYARQTKD